MSNEWTRKGLSFMAGAFLSAGVLLTPVSSLAATTPTPIGDVLQLTTPVTKKTPTTVTKTPTTVTKTPTTVSKTAPKKQEAAKTVPKKQEPKEKLALDSAGAAAEAANAKLTTAQAQLSQSKAVSSKSNAALNKAADSATATKTVYLDANDKLSRMGTTTTRETTLAQQRIKVGKSDGGKSSFVFVLADS
jgi:outer membrane biosynthesis protein TonB